MCIDKLYDVLAELSLLAGSDIRKSSDGWISQWFFMGDELAKVPSCPIERDQLRVPHSNHSFNK